MTAISAGNPHIGRRLVDVLQAWFHKLSTALDQYGQTRVHHTASRSQLWRAQRDIVQVRQAMRRGQSRASHATKEAEFVVTSLE